MTLRMLNQYRDICREIPDLKRRIRKKKKQLAGHREVMASMDEFPYIAQSVPVDRVSREDMRETLILMQQRLRRITRARREVEQYLDSIEDSQLRQIFHLRFMDGLEWKKVTIEIGGGNSEISLKQKVYRHLKFDNQCNKK